MMVFYATKCMEGNTVPLKPIFEKSPLTAYTALPLRPGQVNVNWNELEQLLALCGKAEQHPVMWEGLLRASAAVKAHPEQLPVAGWIEAALDAQQEDGSLPMSVEDTMAVLRAALALYECTLKRELLEKLARWFGYAAENWEAVVIRNDAVRQHPADLMQLMDAMYRITGKKPLLTLMEKLRRQAMDWSGVLHTFAVQRPMSRVTPWADMETGLEAEQGSEQGLYTRQYLTCHGESLADGARSAVANGLYSGNGQELSAAKVGWERISRYHGAVCGGLTCHEHIAGTSPSEGVDAGALGAWAEAFCAAAETAESAWAYDALDVMLTNAMARAVAGGKLNDLQRVNGLSMNCGDAGVYHMHEGEAREVRALARLLRGYAAACSHAVTVSKRGLDVNLLIPGRYAAAVNGSAVTVQMSGSAEKMTLTLRMKQDVHMTLSVRIPAWTADACVTVNNDGGDEGKPGRYLTLERDWKNGDVVTVELEQTLRTVAGHHQSLCVMQGAALMVMPADVNSQWAVAMSGKPALAEDGTVTCEVVPVTWRKRGAVPADLPVLPKAEGKAEAVVLVPYAKQCGIALFPQAGRA